MEIEMEKRRGRFIKASIVLLLAVSMVLLLAVLVEAVTFENEEIEAGLVNFRWCFDNFKGDEFASYKTFWDVYQDNMGCRDVEGTLYAVLMAQYPEQVCNPVPPDCTTSQVQDKNGTWHDSTTCTAQPQVCRTEWKWREEYYDVEKNDMLIGKAQRFCYIATRKAKTGGQACDLNFKYDDGIDSFDAKDYGRQWWNESMLSKFQLNATIATKAPFHPIRFDFNSTAHPYIFSDCQGDFGDVRIVNSTEDGEVVFNITANTSTNLTIFVNVSVKDDNWTGYLYCNATTPQVTASEAIDELELTTGLMGYWSFDDDYTNATHSLDSLGNYNCTIGAGVTTGQTGLVGEAYYFNESSSATVDCNSNEVFNRTYFMHAKIWSNHTFSNTESHDIIMHATKYKLQILTSGGSHNYKTWYYIGGYQIAEEAAGTGSFASDETWRHVSAGYDGATITLWANTTVLDTTAVGGNVSNSDGDLRFGSSDTGTENWIGMIDEIGLWDLNYTTRPELVTKLWERANATSYPFYAAPSISIGGRLRDDEATDLVIGIFNTSYDNISFYLDQGQEFYLFANYTYEANDSTVHPDAWCNYTMYNVYDLDEDSTPGTNATLCLAGCDYSNRTSNFTGLHSAGYISDLYTIRICRDTTATDSDVEIVNNCSASYTYSYATLPLCDDGYLNLTIVDGNCSDGDAEVSITSTAAGTSKQAVLVDDHISIARLHNMTGNLTWNSTLDVYVTDITHAYFDHGYHYPAVDCNANVSGIENQTGSNITITVVNAPPVIFINTISWWLLSDPVAFVNDIAATYPSVGRLNITGGCSDLDLYGAGAYLNYSNGTNIYTYTFLASGNQVPAALNYTRGNFSTNLSFLDGTFGYVFQAWCNDTSDNVTWASRSFTVENSPPVPAWSNGTGMDYSYIPLTFNYTCGDPEGLEYNASVYVNGTYNSSIINGTGFTYNSSTGTYNLSLVCDDGYWNGTDEFLFTYIVECIISTPLCSGCRYQDNEFLFNITCDNNATQDACYVVMNDFRQEEVTCGSANFTAERGWNRLEIIVSTGGVNGSAEYDIWAKDQDADIFDYTIMWVSFLAIVLLFAIGRITGSMLFSVAGCLAGVFLGFELFAFSMIVGTLLVMSSGLCALGIMFRKGRDG